MQEARTTERSSCCRSKLSLCIHIFAYCFKSQSDEDAVAHCATRVVASWSDKLGNSRKRESLLHKLGSFRKRNGADGDDSDGDHGDAGADGDGSGLVTMILAMWRSDKLGSSRKGQGLSRQAKGYNAEFTTAHGGKASFVVISCRLHDSHGGLGVHWLLGFQKHLPAKCSSGGSSPAVN